MFSWAGAVTRLPSGSWMTQQQLFLLEEDGSEHLVKSLLCTQV
jgi:hypothetical protein